MDRTYESHIPPPLPCPEPTEDMEYLIEDNKRLAQEAYLLPYCRARMEREIQRQIEQAAENDRLTAQLKAKDKVLRELLAYAEEGLLIDEQLAAHIEQALKEN